MLRFSSLFLLQCTSLLLDSIMSYTGSGPQNDNNVFKGYVEDTRGF